MTPSTPAPPWLVDAAAAASLMEEAMIPTDMVVHQEKSRDRAGLAFPWFLCFSLIWVTLLLP